MAASPRVAPIQGLPLPVELALILPAGALVVGVNLANDTRCPALEKRDICTPISAIKAAPGGAKSACQTHAPILPTPGIASSCCTGGQTGQAAPRFGRTLCRGVIARSEPGSAASMACGSAVSGCCGCCAGRACGAAAGPRVAQTTPA